MESYRGELFRELYRDGEEIKGERVADDKGIRDGRRGEDGTEDNLLPLQGRRDQDSRSQRSREAPFTRYRRRDHRGRGGDWRPHNERYRRILFRGRCDSRFLVP